MKPIGILGQFWYLIVSIPDLCTLTYYKALICVIYRNVNKLQYNTSLKKVPKPYTYTDYFKWHEHELTSTLFFCLWDVDTNIEISSLSYENK